jgi:2-oxoglutarate dehydrogenase E2 component (dihydrolipoamide succinyltransferase)
MRSAAAIALAGCALALGACASLKPAPASAPMAATPAAPAPAPVAPAAPVVVKAPAPVKNACVPRTLPRAPKYPDTDAALRDAGGAADRYQLMAAGRLLRERRLAELEKVVEGCR